MLQYFKNLKIKKVIFNTSGLSEKSVMVAYLGLTPERGGSLLRGLRFLMTSICGLRTGLITEMVWPLSRLNASGGRADGSSRLSPSG